MTVLKRVVNTRREVVATFAMTTFLLSQWAMPQALWVQGVLPVAQATPPRSVSAGRTTSPSSSTRVAAGKTSGGGTTYVAANRSEAKAKRTSGSDGAPAWYRVSRAKDARSVARMQSRVRVLLAQGPSAPRGAGGTGAGTPTTGTPVVGTRVTGATRAAAASGIPLLRENFANDLRRSADLAPQPYITPLRLDLSNDRVPKQAEITALGGLAGPLSPTAPAEAEEYAKTTDAQLRAEGFEQGLKTPFPSPEEALRVSPGLYQTAKHFDDTKKKVKKARDENRLFALSLQKWNAGQFKVAAQELSDYAKAYPKGPWTAEALIHVANYAKFTGQGNQSEDLYRQVIDMTSNDPADPTYNVHRKALGRLTDLYLIEKRYGEVRPMLADFLKNDTNWRRRTWGLYWMRQIDVLGADPKRRLAQLDCGTRALAALFAESGYPHQARAVFALSPKSERGFSLADLQGLAARQKVTLIGFSAQTSQLSHLPLPVILHYTDKTPAARKRLSSHGHFVLLRSYDAKTRRWQVLNPQDGMQVSLSGAQIGREWSGRGLMLSKAPIAKSPVEMAEASGPKVSLVTSPNSLKSLVRLSMGQMRATYGTGYAVSAQGTLGCSACNKGGNSCGNPPGGGSSAAGSGPLRNTPMADAPPSPGSPSVSVNRVTQNIYIVDTPLWYKPAKGPSVNLTLSYNSQDASNYNSLMGNKWSFAYGSYIAEMPNRVLVFMPDGKQDVYTPAESVGYVTDQNGNAITYPSGTYVPPRGNFSTLAKIGANAWTLTSQGGDTAVFGIPTGVNSSVPVLLEVRDCWNQSLHFSYNVVGGRVVPTSISDADGNLTRLGYDGSGHLVSAQTPDERQASFSYDGNGNLIQCVDAAGQAFQYAYDGMVNITQLNTAQGPWTFDIQASPFGGTFNANTTTITDPSSGRPEIYRFYSDYEGAPGIYTYDDHRGNRTTFGVSGLEGVAPTDHHSVITSIQTPQGQTTSQDYSATPSSSLSPSGSSNGVVQSTTTYNDQGMPLTYTTAGRTITLSYASNGLDVMATSVSGTQNGATLSQTLLQSASYNDQHQPLQIVDNTGRVTTYTYTTWGAPQTVTTTEGSGAGALTHTVQYGYGTTAGSYNFNRIVSLVRDGTLQGSYNYDSSGRVSSATDARGLTLSYVYNNIDGVTAVMYPDGTKTTTDYACCALPGMVTDRSGRRSYYDYDALKRLVRMQDADGQTLQFQYDGDGNHTGLLDARGNWTRWSYDGNNRVTQKRYADGKGESYSYRTNDGMLASSTNGRGQTTIYSYDSREQLSGIDYPNSLDVVMDRDALGRLTSMSDGSGTTNWTYDAYGRPQSEDGPFASDMVSYGYDSLGRLAGTSVQRPGGMSDVTTLGYDTLGRLSSVTGNMGDFGTVGQFGYSYAGSTSQLTQIARPNGVNTNYGYETGPGSLQRLTQVANVAGTDNLSSFGYSYGNSSALGGFRDNRVSQSKQYGNEAAQNVSYGYNTTLMLTSEGATAGGSSTPAFNFSYSFDPMGNRTRVAKLSAQTRTDSAYNRLNQLAQSSSYDTTGTAPALTGTTAYGYDSDGNMSQSISKDAGGATTATASYVYDDDSRLVSITSASSKWDFCYDGLSRLRVSTYSTGSVSNWTVQSQTRRVYKGMDVVQERDGSNAVTASLTRTGNIGGILARSTVSGHSYFGYDGGGNVTTLTSTTGAVVGSYTYDAWGNLLTSSGARANENLYRFSSKESVAGLYSYGYRFYSPGLGRWINRDPIQENGGTNVYGFVENDPISKIDLQGLAGATISIYGGLEGGVGPYISGGAGGSAGVGIFSGGRPKSGCPTGINGGGVGESHVYVEGPGGTTVDNNRGVMVGPAGWLDQWTAGFNIGAGLQGCLTTANCPSSFVGQTDSVTIGGGWISEFSISLQWGGGVLSLCGNVGGGFGGIVNHQKGTGFVW